MPKRLSTIALLPSLLGCLLCSCSDSTGGCSYDSDCPGIEICIDGECVPNRCPDIPCKTNETCVKGECYLSDCPGVICGENQVCQNGLCVDINCLEGECPCSSDSDCPPGFRCDEQVCVRIEAGIPQAQSFTAGGATLTSENYRFELFIAPVCPTGTLQSVNHRLRLGPAAYTAPEP